MALTLKTRYKRRPSPMTISLKVIIPTNLAASSPSQKREKGEAGGQLPDFLSEVFPPQILYPTSQCWEHGLHRPKNLEQGSPGQHRGQRLGTPAS